MKILAVADIHAKKKKIALVRQAVKTHHPDLLVIAGDIMNYFNPNLVLDDLKEIDQPILYIRGNSDPKRFDKLVIKENRLKSLHLNKLAYDGFNIVGVSGTVPLPFHSKVTLRESKLCKQLEALVDGKSVLVCHPPPYGSLDKVFGRFSAGSRGLKNLISTRKPLLVICGHIHENVGIVKYKETTIVNCSVGMKGKGMLIDIEGSEITEIQPL